MLFEFRTSQSHKTLYASLKDKLLVKDVLLKNKSKMTESYLTKNKVEFFLFTDKNMNRTIADEKDKVEILISTEKEGKRFETTYKDLLEILESADEKLSQSRKI